MALGFLGGAITPLMAQNSIRDHVDGARRPAEEVRPLAVDDLEGRDGPRFIRMSLPGNPETPAMKATARLQEGREVFVTQDAATLGASTATPGHAGDAVDLTTLREPSPFRKVAMATGTSTSAAEATAGDLPMRLDLLSATYRAPGGSSGDVNCSALGLAIRQRVTLDPARLLEIVESEVTANTGCSCEIVKAALSASDADATLAARVVETAATAAPESMRLISQCAIAMVPESLADVQAVLARLDPNSGESGKSSKSAKGEALSAVAPETPPKDPFGNPLDLPYYRSIQQQLPAVIRSITEVDP